MPFEVFGLFYRCSEFHDSHRTLWKAAECHAEIAATREGDTPVHPVTGKYVHAIAAVDRYGKQRDFQKSEVRIASEMGLDPKTLLTQKPAIANFNTLARMYCDALGSIPMLTVDLDRMFDPDDQGHHFWASESGRGQCLAYILQAAFTLELCIKALLESCGKFAEPPGDDRPDWQTHSPVQLYNLLEQGVQQRLEQWWKSRSADECHFDGSYIEFLRSIDDLYIGLRYLQRDLKGVNPQVEIAGLLSASRMALKVSDFEFRNRLPMKITTTVNQSSGSDGARLREFFMEGLVRELAVPEGFDPHGPVVAIVDTEDGQQVSVRLFRKADVESYHGIVGDHVTFEAYVSEDQSSVINSARLLHRSGPKQPGTSYSNEQRTLSGTVFNLERCEFDRLSQAIRLILDDATYFSKVECIFSTKEEVEQLADVHLGHHVLIRGQVSLRNGRPMVLLEPQILLVDAEDQAKTSQLPD